MGHNYINIDIDVKQLDEVLTRLSGSDMVKAQRRALAKAGRLLYNQTKKNAASMVPNSSNRNPRYSDTLNDGVRMSVFQDTDFKYYFKVHVLGIRKKTSGTYRLRFFEGGTAPRKTNKGYNRGQLKATNFFASAINTTQSNVITAIDSNLTEEINRIVNQ